MIFFQNLSDSKLYAECKRFGLESLKARWKFIGLLPEVSRRENAARMKGKSWLERRGFNTLEMFASKLAGVSSEQVKLVLRLDRRFEEMSLIRTALLKGEFSINKFARIASIAKRDNQKELLEKMQKLSVRALEIFAKSENRSGLQMQKIAERDVHVNAQNSMESYFVNQRDLESSRRDQLQIDSYRIVNEPYVNEPLVNESQTDVFHVPNQALAETSDQLNKQETAVANEKFMDHQIKHTWSVAKITQLHIDRDIENQLLELQKKGVDINNLFRQFLKQRDEKIERELEEISHEVRINEASKVENNQRIGRYISVKVKHIIKEKYGSICSTKNCGKPSVELHHENLFSKWQSHDPKILKPLCKAHHELVHEKDKCVQSFRRLLTS